MSDKPISYMPTPGLTYDPEDAHYWDENSLAQEIERAFEICHGCRMCFKYCDSFPNLFKFIDEECDGNVKKLTPEHTQKVVDDCFQCKLCEVQCPYTPRDNHEYQLDFPKIIHRYNAIKFKKQGTSLQNKFVADADRAGQMARLSFGMANKMNKVKLHRIFMESIVGIHRDKLLPDFASESFSAWAKKRSKLKAPDKSVESVLFQTCYVENNEPEIGQDVLEVMEKNSVNCASVEGFKCCGMPFWEHGDLGTLRKNAKHNIEKLLPYVESGAKVLVINPTCSMMMRREYPELVAKEDREKAQKVADAVQDPGEFLWEIRNEERFNTDFKTTPNGSVGYHAPCHLRAQAKGFKGRDLLRKIPGVTPKAVMECCGHDGTYAMKKQSFEKSLKVGKKAFDGMKQTEGEVWSTECPLAAIQFKQAANIKPLHPMSILAKAYREDGFKHKVPPQESSS